MPAGGAVNGSKRVVSEMQSSRPEGWISSVGHHRCDMFFPGWTARIARGPKADEMWWLRIYLGRLVT
jgi:hypothetical protein